MSTSNFYNVYEIELFYFYSNDGVVATHDVSWLYEKFSDGSTLKLVEISGRQ